MIVYTMVGCINGVRDTPECSEMFPDGIHEWVATSGYLSKAPEWYTGQFRFHSGVNVGGWRPFRQTYEAEPCVVGFVLDVFHKYDTIQLDEEADSERVGALRKEWARLQEFAREHGKVIPDCEYFLILDHD